MNNRRVHFIALESSGRRWIETTIGQHPCIKATGNSYPSAMGVGRSYEAIDFQNIDILAVVVRDKSCHRASVALHKYESENTPGEFNDAQSVAWITDEIRRAAVAGRRVVWIDYEAAVLFKRVYFDGICASLGVAAFDFDMEIRDGNESYFKNP